ncbi:hypothetical protein EPA93_45255 [Ktedonosporobacter rubrisoli]|uniref:Uncharacterized protein n=1 Tax=Ktedonosporobacter rubrisoli TaxID=2509675 RepID=A0A4P6K3R2_KTERU|nr:hypothetical protein [Ktedonosporobacter rubrisoli]QBD82794.1 hypothetical protein EPA93_45255 [Ktedonosporobacter rubrisoli]
MPMVSLVTSVTPSCYPLSESMVHFLAEERQIPSTFTIPFDLDVSHPSSLEHINELRLGFIQRWWSPLIREIADLRIEAEKPLRSALEGHEKLTTKEFVDILYQKTPLVEKRAKVSGMTVSRWRGRGFIRTAEENDEHIAVETALAVLMMRLADTRHQKGWLPPGSHTCEPYMYVWQQNGPGQPVLPCGLPLHPSIPPHAFLFTPFRFLGVLYPDHWFAFGDLGSVRFAGTIQKEKHLLWNLTEEEIRLWDPTIEPLGRGILDTFALQARDNLANLVLLKLATQAFAHHIAPF